MRLGFGRALARLREVVRVESDRPLLARTLSWTVSVWVVHAILRLAVLGRPDAFGLPLVGKLDWYLFHAWSFDARWIAVLSIPFVAHVAFWELRARWWAALGMWTYFVLHSLLLLLTVCDHEMQRFMGGHLTPTMLGTYGNTGSLIPLWSFLAADKGGRYLPLVLLLGSPFAAAGISYALRSVRWFSDRPRWLATALAAWAFVGAGWIFTEVAWGGRNRALKLAPLVRVWWDAWDEANRPPLPEAEFAELASRWRSQWLSTEGDSGWVFPDPDLPYWHVPKEGIQVAAPDSAANIVLVVLESHRAINAGFLKPWGATADATPFLDTIAPQGESWTDFQVAALPTVRSLTSLHLGILNHPDRNIVSDYLNLSNLSFSAILGEHGWTTRFFSAADPAWDNQTPWLRQWYHAFDYDRTRETDATMFAHAARWMRDSLEAGKPFLVTLMTKTNHYPFNLPADAGEPDPGPDLQARMRSTMLYTEQALAAFVDSLRAQPWFSRTIFVFTGDHGFPLDEHGCSNMGCGLFDESTRVPFVLWGASPRIAPGVVHHGAASSIDIAPTILSLAGVRAANHFTGRDLTRGDSTRGVRLANHYQELLVRGDSVVVHGTIAPDAGRTWGRQAFDRLRDPRQTVDRWSEDSTRFESLLQEARGRTLLLQEILRRNALAPMSR